MQIFFVIPTNKLSGPNRQLLNIISWFLDQTNANISLLFLRRHNNSHCIDLESVSSLYPSRVRILIGLQYFPLIVRNLLFDSIKTPKYIISCGILPDLSLFILSSLLSSLSHFTWVSILRCQPLVEYPIRYGRYKGHFFAKLHIACLCYASKLITVSKSVSLQLPIKKKAQSICCLQYYFLFLYRSNSI